MKKKLLIIAVILLLYIGYVNAASDVIFGWNANTEPDLAGYKLYQGVESKVYIQSYDIPLSVLADFSNPEFALTDIADGEYFWALTAYDESGNESGYSNEVTKVLDTIAPQDPSQLIIKRTIKIIIE